MDLLALRRNQLVETELKINGDFGKIMPFIDYGNVDYWYRDDRQSPENQPLADDEYVSINLDGLKEFSDLLGPDGRFYYGHPPNAIAFLTSAKFAFGKKVFTKQIQYVRHHLSEDEAKVNKRPTQTDKDGAYIFIPKCNFDVEITVDAIRLCDSYDTIALFSGDADFVSLLRYLKKKGKKIILIKNGNITSSLRAEADLIINAQEIKRHITYVKKRKPGN